MFLTPILSHSGTLVYVEVLCGMGWGVQVPLNGSEDLLCTSMLRVRHFLSDSSLIASGYVNHQAAAALDRSQPFTPWQLAHLLSSTTTTESTGSMPARIRRP